MTETQYIEAIGPDDTGLRATLAWSGDRVIHYVDWVAGRQSFRLLESVEGDEQQEWPPSPALQQLTIEQRSARRQVALLVGMAGQSHWSVSIENEPSERRLTFDVACRIAEPSNQLGSQYRTPAQVNISSPDQGAELTVAGRRCQLVLESTGRGESDLLEFNKGLLRIVATQQLTTYPDTLRWKYSLLG